MPDGLVLWNSLWLAVALTGVAAITILAALKTRVHSAAMVLHDVAHPERRR